MTTNVDGLTEKKKQQKKNIPSVRKMLQINM